MAGTRQWEIHMAFFVTAEDDDEARNKITSTLPHDTRYAWAWLATKGLPNKGETNDANN